MGAGQETELAMKTTHRSYDEEAGDFHRLCRFVRDHHAQVRARSSWCLSRIVDWKYGLYENKLAVPAFCDRNAHLWFDAFGDLAGFAIAENGDAGFAIITLDGYQFLFEEILRWVLQAWGDRGPRFSIEITARQHAEAGVLERWGFRRRATFYTRCFDLTREPEPRMPLERGFTIVDMATHPDYRRQRILRDDAFGNPAPSTEDALRRELRFYNYSHEGPIYHPQTDLCVMAEDGRFVAGCEALIDARNAEADIERVCTHSDFRRRGFARAVIQECLARLRDMGLRRAYITGYSPEAIALYGSLGHVSEAQSFLYETDASASG
jgi:ribosomal protein S18 acetylase RimI-like enzyme